MTLKAMVKKFAFYHKGWMPLQGSKQRDVVSSLCLGGQCRLGRTGSRRGAASG